MLQQIAGELWEMMRQWRDVITISGVIGTFLAGIWLAIRSGLKKTPAEVGMAPVSSETVDYVLVEVRQIGSHMATRADDIDARLDKYDTKLDAIHIDTQILRDRSRR